jgi:hypothetical protein
VEWMGFEPTASCVQNRRSPLELPPRELGITSCLAYRKAMDVTTLDYSRLPDELRRQQTRHRVLTILVLAFGILTFLNCSFIEYLNYRAGSVLPFAPLPPNSRHTWRTPFTDEVTYRIEILRPTGDPLWETRPLTLAEQSDLRRLKARDEAEGTLCVATLSVCLLIPLIPLVFIFAVALIFRERSFKWRLAMIAIGIAQIVAAATFVHLGLLEALSRNLD